MRRLFFATKIELPDQVLTLKRQLHYDMQFHDMVWVQEAVSHLTLRFIGKTPEPKVQPLKEALREVCGQQEKFSLTLNKVGVFGSKYHPTVLWYGFEDFSPFKKLFELLEPKVLDLGFEAYQGNFVPHITLARIKKITDRKHFQDAIDKHPLSTPVEIPIQEVTLYQSFLRPEGPEYKPLATFPLQ